MDSTHSVLSAMPHFLDLLTRREPESELRVLPTVCATCFARVWLVSHHKMSEEELFFFVLVGPGVTITCSKVTDY